MLHFYFPEIQFLAGYITKLRKNYFPVSLAVGVAMWLSPDQWDVCNIRIVLLLVGGYPPLFYCWNVHIVMVCLFGSFRWGQYLRGNREQDWKRLGPSTIRHHPCPGQLISKLLQEREVTSILFKTLPCASLSHDVPSVYENSLFHLPMYVSSPSTHLWALPYVAKFHPLPPSPPLGMCLETSLLALSPKPAWGVA